MREKEVPIEEKSISSLPIFITDYDHLVEVSNQTDIFLSIKKILLGKIYQTEIRLDLQISILRRNIMKTEISVLHNILITFEMKET